MNTRFLKIDREDPQRDHIAEAAQVIRAGGLVAFPTETVYGLGGNALDPEASAKIYAAKGRPSDNPLIAHIADREELYELVSEIPAAAERQRYSGTAAAKKVLKKLRKVLALLSASR